jgi:prepilin-type N-terminal cleavage/methylation domain-containing protein
VPNLRPPGTDHEGGLASRGAHPLRLARPPAFSLVELVIVVAILAIVAAIAVPRLSHAADRAQAARLDADVSMMQRAIERYAAEHSGLSPAHRPDGVVSTDASLFERKLTLPTTAEGLLTGATIFGPYIRAMPVNPVNRLGTLRINGAPAGAGTHGWHFNADTMLFLPDHENAVVGGKKVVDGKLVDP